MSGVFGRRPEKAKRCPTFGPPGYSPFEVTLQIFTALAVAAMIAVIASVAVSRNRQLSEYVVNFKCTGENVLGSTGATIGRARGQVLVDITAKDVTYELFPYDLAEITKIHLYGPINATNEDTGAEIFLPLCGAPSEVACSEAELPLTQTVTCDGGLGLRGESRDIADSLYRYYIKIHTIDFPDGAVQCDFASD